jgi:4-hydroxy-3-polyprenylbenzoate decarboxylase
VKKLAIEQEDRMPYYKDLREYIELLEERGKLLRIKSEVVRETQVGPLYWLQYRGLPEVECKPILFEKVVDVKGRKLGSLLLGAYASSREVVALGMMCPPEEMNEKWAYTASHPIEPEMVASGPVQEVVITGAELDKLGLEMLPAPNEAPGFSATIRTTQQFITKDPETGIRNVGTYSGHINGRKSLRWGIGVSHHGYISWMKCREKGIRLQVAIVIGVTPNIALTGSSPLAYGVDELAIAGGLAGEPVRLVKCKTVDLEVPATAEIVIEGEVSNEYMEPLTAFADYPGYVYEPEGALRPIIDVSCITHRKDPMFVTTMVGYLPHETAILGGIARELGIYRHLKYECGLPVLDVAFPAFGGGSAYCVVKIKKASPWQPWQVLNAVMGYVPGNAKITIVVDEDINPRDPEAVNWALAFAMQPHRDIRIVTHRVPALDPSAYPPGASAEERRFPSPSGSSALVIDATRKWAYTPVGLPRKEFMEQALEIWEKEGLPQLQLRTPWHGYHLGRWTADDEENAELTLKGEHFKLAEKLKERRKRLS